MTKIVIIREADMQNAPLYAAMTAIDDKRLATVQAAINRVVEERTEYEAQRERIIEGVLKVGQSPDVEKHLAPLVDHEAFARMVAALKISPRGFLFPQTTKGGKSDNQTSNLKSYRKARQISEVILHGSSDLENVAKVFAVCAFRFAQGGHGLLTREFCSNFLSSRQFTEIDTGTADLWSAIDDIRAKTMTTGAETQSGQMVRQLVALKSAVDVRDGRKKNVQVNPDGLVMQALMTRLGQLTEAEA